MIIKIKVKTNSNNNDIEKINKENYKINLKSIPENNKANLELIKLLKKFFKKEAEVREIKIIKGLKSNEKVVEIK